MPLIAILSAVTAGVIGNHYHHSFAVGLIALVVLFSLFTAIYQGGRRLTGRGASAGA